MTFELATLQQVTFTNANARSEYHGEEHVRAIDIAMRLVGENALLERIEPGLREHHYTDRDAKAGQKRLPGVHQVLPHLRFPKLPTRIAYGKREDKLRGYRFVIDYGLGGASSVELEDCVLASVWYELQEGGSVTVGFTVQYNGDDLNDDALYGRLAALATTGEGHVQLLAPASLVQVQKGWRSGHADTPTVDGGGALFDETQDEDQDDVVHASGTPEAALAATEKAESSHLDAWPFPTDKPSAPQQEHPQAKPKARGRRAAVNGQDTAAAGRA